MTLTHDHEHIYLQAILNIFISCEAMPEK